MFLNVFKCFSSHKNAKKNAKYATYEWEKQPFQKNCKMTRNAKKQNAEKMHCRIWPRWHSQSLACEPKTDLFFVQMLTQPLRLFFRNRFVLRSFFFWTAINFAVVLFSWGRKLAVLLLLLLLLRDPRIRYVSTALHRNSPNVLYFFNFLFRGSDWFHKQLPELHRVPTLLNVFYRRCGSETPQGGKRDEKKLCWRETILISPIPPI